VFGAVRAGAVEVEVRVAVVWPAVRVGVAAGPDGVVEATDRA
jgi:hypothetical protein